jgi:hypothetical protein
MLRWVLILSCVCVLLIVALALTRRDGGSPRPTAREPAEVVTSVERVLPPPPAKTTEQKVDPAPVVELPPDQQVQDDAAAVGMTTLEQPEAPAAEPSP